ncbi:hypothetical protein J2Z76_000428 [Sedimentibacter acidaminivorans]|jgi:hypothetical protein|uniref:Uncharacterized protein n=1 Tax=Sedimentibacter acidaminivorans TaxID=913099 RepID=A0ABS4GA58_9FIRM|nr:hypothetical protein [Sedimentibacter acidaminivorans]MBP1924575.1 hypothetical protein [Sedimentibacter acidaminivorans]
MEILKKFSPLLILFPGIILGFMGKPTEMGLSIASGCLFCVFLNLDKFTKFKGAGFEAELKQTIKEAEVTIEKMRNLMKPIIIFTYNQLTYNDRMGGIPINKINTLFTDINSIVQELSLNDDKSIKQEQEKLIKSTAWGSFSNFYTDLYYTKQTDSINELQELNNLDTINYPTEAVINNILNKHNTILNTNQSKKLEEYLNYIREHFNIE